MEDRDICRIQEEERLDSREPQIRIVSRRDNVQTCSGDADCNS
jgi:hypothetical protein